MNVQWGCTGMEQSASAVQEGRFLTPQRMHVNVHQGRGGMGLDVQPSRYAQMDVNGMCLSLCVSAP